MRTVLASLALALLAAGPAWAQASRPVTPTDPFPWSVEAPEAQPGKWRICLWLPTLQGYVDATGNANALFRSHQRTTFVTLYTTRAAEAEAPLDLEGAWLETPAGRLEPLIDPRLGNLEPGRTVSGDGPGASVNVLLGFTPLEQDWSRLALHVPFARPREGGPRELVLRLFRWRERVAAVEANLEGWRRHTERPEIRLTSALGPWLTCEAADAFRAWGERFTVPFLLRELSRGEAGLRALPRFVVLHELAATTWGARNEVPEAGAADVAAAVLRRWRERNGPALPGVGPRDQAY